MSFNVDDYYAKAAEYAAGVVDNPAQTTYAFDPDLMHIYDVRYPDGPEHIFIMSMDRTGESEGQYSKAPTSTSTTSTKLATCARTGSSARKCMMPTAT